MTDSTGFRPASDARQSKKRRPNRRIGNRRLQMETLESRTVMAVLTVTDLGDNTFADGKVTLREAVLAANSNSPVGDSPAGSGADTIEFAPGLSGAIFLREYDSFLDTALQLNGTLSINGPGSASLSVYGGWGYRPFTTGIGSTVTISGLTISGGTDTEYV